ncbi:hypothetical protein K488DRAFT_86505 [Vararia minispora EC-137]|uniref:Uncharacterized protein n=1 Tax=Vararia minispora EC-137 TaxID=1314806 RepID=A0ACB8QIU6_9AGAM|nr:hypothetical protein K488DRAFT_86505 [Vararia minispora EC-137]
MVAMDHQHAGWIASTLHSGKNQEQEQWEAALQQPRTGDADMLITTDLTGCGIDVQDVSLVINYQMASTIGHMSLFQLDFMMYHIIRNPYGYLQQEPGRAISAGQAQESLRRSFDAVNQQSRVSNGHRLSGIHPVYPATIEPPTLLPLNRGLQTALPSSQALPHTAALNTSSEDTSTISRRPRPRMVHKTAPKEVVEAPQIPALDSDEDEFPEIRNVLDGGGKATVASAATTATSSQTQPAYARAKPTTAKGKTKATGPVYHVSDSEDEGSHSRHTRGRKPGAYRYGDAEESMLCDCIKEYGDAGSGKDWKTIAKAYNAWAIGEGLPTRTESALRAQWGKLCRPTKPPTGDGDGEKPIRIRAREIEDGIHQGVGIRFCNDRADPLKAKPRHIPAKPLSSDDDIEILDGPPPSWQGPYVHVKKEASATVKSEPTDVRLSVKPDPDKPSFSASSVLPQSKGSAVKAGTKVTSTKATSSAELREGIARVFDPEIRRARDIAKYDQARQLQEDSFHFQENYRLRAELDKQRDTNEPSPVHAPKQLPVAAKGSEGESGLKMEYAPSPPRTPPFLPRNTYDPSAKRLSPTPHSFRPLSAASRPVTLPSLPSHLHVPGNTFSGLASATAPSSHFVFNGPPPSTASSSRVTLDHPPPSATSSSYPSVLPSFSSLFKK